MKITDLIFLILYKIKKRVIIYGFNFKIDFKILASYI